jgi:di/tricarboxylate transporter
MRRAAPGIATAALAIGIWIAPAPQGLTIEAWRLFAIFAAAIFAVVSNALPILSASLVAVAAAVLSGVVTPEKAYAGFSNGTILLIVLAFLIARAVVKCGLRAPRAHGYLTQGELYRLGAITTAMLAALYLLIGTPWLMLVLR